LEAGANPSFKDNMGMNALDIAVATNHINTVKYLLSHPKWQKMLQSM
jgi:ankyrin repeat protein